MKIKKGGDYQLILTGFKDLDVVTIPAGTMIESISVKKANTTAGNIKMGDYVPAVAEVLSIVVTHVATEAGNISVSLRGADPVLVAITDADTIDDIVTKIAAEEYEGYTVAADTDTDTVTWTATVAGAKSGVTTVTGPAGFAKTGPTEDTAGADATAGEQTVAEVALSTVAGNISNLTLVKKSYAEETRIYIGVSSEATGDIAFCLQNLF